MFLPAGYEGEAELAKRTRRLGGKKGAAPEKALGLEQTETLPELSEADVLDTPHLRWVQVSSAGPCGGARAPRLAQSPI